MAVVLAVDASTDACSVALVGASLKVHLTSVEPRSHAQKLLPMVHEILNAHGLKLHDLSAIAYGSGPGSFTGLRIGLGVAQGLAFGAGLPMVAVSSLLAMAHSAARESGGELDAAVCVLDARMAELYWSAYSIEANQASLLIDPTLSKPVDAQKSLNQFLLGSGDKRIALIGPGAELLDEAFRRRFVSHAPEIRPSALAVAELGLKQFAEGRVVPPELAELTYLRNSVSWNRRQRIRSPAAG